MKGLKRLRTKDLILSGKSFMKIKKIISKTVPLGTPDKTGTGSEAWPSPVPREPGVDQVCVQHADSGSISAF